MKRLLIRGTIVLVILSAGYGASHSGRGFDQSARSPQAQSNANAVNSGQGYWLPCPAGTVVAPDPAYCISQ